MEHLTWIVLAVFGVVGAVVVHFLSHDLYAAAPRYAERLLRRAAELLPRYIKARYEEEWLAHLTDCTGAFSKLNHAFQCLICARQLNKFYRSKKIGINIDGHVMHLELPTAAVVFEHIFRALPDDEGGVRFREVVATLFEGVNPLSFDIADADPCQLREFGERLKNIASTSGGRAPQLDGGAEPKA